MASTSPKSHEQTYPIAEVFDSIQGEGRWTGTPMRFIRVAGCNVGKPKIATDYRSLYTHGASFHVLENHPHNTICTTWSGSRMLCDTDYRKHHNAKIGELVPDELENGHVCITGGEPFLYDLTPLILHAQGLGIMVHIETSGTLPILLDPLVNRRQLWITCSPKMGVLVQQSDAFNEIKILVYPTTTIESIQEFLSQMLNGSGYLPQVYIQPITNAVDKPDERALRRAIDIVQECPAWSLSAQMHKYWGVR